MGLNLRCYFKFCPSSKRIKETTSCQLFDKLWNITNTNSKLELALVLARDQLTKTIRICMFFRKDTHPILLRMYHFMFHWDVSFFVNFGYMGCCDFSINNPKNTCFITWLSTWNITFWVKYSITKSGDNYIGTENCIKSLTFMLEKAKEDANPY